MTRIMKKRKLRRARKKPPPLELEPGARLVVETLSTASCATVVWQVRDSFCSQLNVTCLVKINFSILDTSK